MEDLRAERGKAIAASKKLRQAPDGTWIVLSQTQSGVRYRVDAIKATCSCPDFTTWEMACKHLHAVSYFHSPDPATQPMLPPKPTYPQQWTAYNKAQTQEKELFQGLLRDLCSGLAWPPQENGRPRIPLSDVVYTAATKVYTTFSGRRATTDIRECQEKGFVESAPHYNSISFYMGDATLTPMLKNLIEVTAAPLKAVESQFAVDATGFGTSVYDRWFDHKHRRDTKARRWVKCHAMVGTRTNVVTAVETTKSNVHDITQLPDLVERTAANFDVRQVAADKAYLSHTALSSIEGIGATPYIPMKSNSQMSDRSATWNRLFYLFSLKLDEFKSSYHRRSNVETSFSMIKKKFGGSVRSKKFEAQANEVLLKVLCHNIVVLIHEMFELGIAVDLAQNSGTIIH